MNEYVDWFQAAEAARAERALSAAILSAVADEIAFLESAETAGTEHLSAEEAAAPVSPAVRSARLRPCAKAAGSAIRPPSRFTARACRAVALPPAARSP